MSVYLSAGVFVSFPAIIFSRRPGAAKHKLASSQKGTRKARGYKPCHPFFGTPSLDISQSEPFREA